MNESMTTDHIVSFHSHKSTFRLWAQILIYDSTFSTYWKVYAHTHTHKPNCLKTTEANGKKISPSQRMNEYDEERMNECVPFLPNTPCLVI